MTFKSGAQLLVDVLTANGVDRVFCVPGESYLAVLDALHDTREIETVVCRHEGGVAMMAEADGKLTGRPGIAFVTRGPGATNATAGLHVAMQDSTPMVLFIGQIARASREREAFQELDYRRMLGQLSKLTIEIDSAERVPEIVGRAFRTATSGRPGPVVIVLPEDMLEESVEAVDLLPNAPVEIYPSLDQLAELDRMIEVSERPLLLVGGSRWDASARESLQLWAAARELPVVTAFRRQDRFDNTNPCYVGDMGIGTNPDLLAYLASVDLLVVVGARLDDLTTAGYSRLAVPTPGQKIVHVFPSAEELGKVYRTNLAIVATPRGFAAMLPNSGAGKLSRATETARLRASYEKWQQPLPAPGTVNMSEIVSEFRKQLPHDAIITNGAGNFATWVHRFHRFEALGSQLAPTSGSMGYGLPAAVAAKLRFKDRTVVCVAGDGDFQMTCQEFGTAAQAGANIICVVVDNAMYGTIRMHQEREYPGRVQATGLENPDFAMIAKAYGCFGETVVSTDQFFPALTRAMDAGRPALLHVIVDPEALTPAQTLSAIRSQTATRTP
ncbi:thiamine pyrophosphate-binding protein [Arvimicrobium flavum]|uniref:thiamine pyrophosphate-binding protein n=1 Tax=Arvimicrobium flavum TaxID=3393320 RepID=UPI00237C014C|nr:thiamine pyrophosphate-binding protein [Mesorhizobium shangrilense]